MYPLSPFSAPAAKPLKTQTHITLSCYLSYSKCYLTRNVCETCIPPKLKHHCDLDLWPRNPKFSRGHLLVITNYHYKLEDPWAVSSLVINRTRFVRTDMCKAIYPLFFKGAIKILCISFSKRVHIEDRHKFRLRIRE